jgi:hypothetical protein
MKYTRLAIVFVPLVLSGCETVNSVGTFARNIDWNVLVPWKTQQEAVASTKPAQPVAAAQMASVAAAPDGLQRDDLREPFGENASGTTAVASREGL